MDQRIKKTAKVFTLNSQNPKTTGLLKSSQSGYKQRNGLTHLRQLDSLKLAIDDPISIRRTSHMH